jgi:hypothetical protein
VSEKCNNYYSRTKENERQLAAEMVGEKKEKMYNLDILGEFNKGKLL